MAATSWAAGCETSSENDWPASSTKSPACPAAEWQVENVHEGVKTPVWIDDSFGCTEACGQPASATAPSTATAVSIRVTFRFYLKPARPPPTSLGMSDEQIHELVHELFSGAVRIQRVADDLRVQLQGPEASQPLCANDDVELDTLPTDLTDLTDLS